MDHFIYRFSDEHKDGLKVFIENATKYARHPYRMIFPCAKCKNCSTKSHKDAFENLFVDDFDPLYKEQVLHGENPSYPFKYEENANKVVPYSYRMFQNTIFINANCSDLQKGQATKIGLEILNRQKFLCIQRV